MTREVRRYEVPVDDRPHALTLGGPILAVGCREPHVVEFWAMHDPAVTWRRWFHVHGTGHELPDLAVYVGTAVAPGGRFVWHLFETTNTPEVNG